MLDRNFLTCPFLRFTHSQVADVNDLKELIISEKKMKRNFVQGVLPLLIMYPDE